MCSATSSIVGGSGSASSGAADSPRTARSMRGRSPRPPGPCVQRPVPGGSSGRLAASSPSAIVRRGATAAMQCASAGPGSPVLSRATTPPTRLMPSQIAT